MSHTRLVSCRGSPRGQAMIRACPPSRLPPLLETLEPRLLLDVGADPLPSPAPPTLTAPGNEIPVELVGQWGGPARTVAVTGHFAHLCLGRSLCVLDVADPAQPRLLGKVVLAGLADPLGGEGLKTRAGVK